MEMVSIECFCPCVKKSLPKIIFPRPILKMQSKFQVTNISWSDIIHTYFVFFGIHPNSTRFGVFDYKTILLGCIPTMLIGFFPAFFFQAIQVNLCQKLLSFHQLTHNMIWWQIFHWIISSIHEKFKLRTWGKHVVHRNCFDIQNNSCTQHVLPMFCK